MMSDVQVQSILEEDLIIESLMNPEDFEKNYGILVEIIQASGSYHQEICLEPEFEFYLKNLHHSGMIEKFFEEIIETDSILQCAIRCLKLHSTKCDAILYFLIEDEDAPISEDTIIHLGCRDKRILFKLIDKGGYIYGRLWTGHTIAHAAVIGEQIDVIKYLMKKNVNFDCADINSATPINLACDLGNLEMVQLLLENDLDLSIASQLDDYKTPIDLAICKNRIDILSVLLNSTSADYLAIEYYLSSFMYFCSHDFDIFKLEIFKLIWKKFVDIKIMDRTSTRNSILKEYFAHRGFASEYWFDGLKIIMTSNISINMIDEFLSDDNIGIFSYLMFKFHELRFEKSNRIYTLNRFLSLGFKPNFEEITDTVFYFKFGAEFDLLSSVVVNERTLNEEGTKHYVGRLFCGLENIIDYSRIFTESLDLDEEFTKFLKQYFTPSTFVNPSENNSNNSFQVMSLQEISRNSCRQFMNENARITSFKEFLNTLKSFNLPNRVENLILFKTPIDKSH